MERLTSLLLRHLHQAFQVLVSLFSIAVVDVWQESEYADDLAGVFALVIIDLLLDHFMNLGLNVSLVEQITNERSDALSVS